MYTYLAIVPPTRGISRLAVSLVVLSLVVLGRSLAFSQVGQNDVHIVPRSTIPTRDQVLTLKTTVNLVLVNVTVTDSRERLVSDLRASDFSLLDDKQPQHIKYFSREDMPISIALVFDTSESMKNYMEQARQAAIEFYRASNPKDEFTVITFGDRPETLLDFSDPIASLGARLQPIQAKGHTSLWDATYLALEKMQKARYSKRAVLLISDGGDNHSRYTEGELRSILREADVQVYAVAPYKNSGRLPEDKSGLLWLDEVTSETGGRVFAIHEPNELLNAVTQISDELRNQYVLGYLPAPGARNGKWHKLKVKLNTDRTERLRTYAKNGYYGPAE
jgi:Ca-activated chloride channel family protein